MLSSLSRIPVYIMHFEYKSQVKTSYLDRSGIGYGISVFEAIAGLTFSSGFIMFWTAGSIEKAGSASTD